MAVIKIFIEHDRKRYKYFVEELSIENGRERWKLIAKNKTLLLSNNRPVFEKRNLKHRAEKPEWRIDEGVCENLAFRESIYEAIEWLKRNF